MWRLHVPRSIAICLLPRAGLNMERWSSVARAVLEDIDVHFLKLPQEEQMARRIDERASRFCREQMNVRLVSCLTNLLRSLLMGVLHQICLVVRNHFLLEKDRKLRLSVPVCRVI